MTDAEQTTGRDSARTARQLTWLLFLASLAAFELVWGRRFYSSLTNLAHDFALAGTGLLEGRNWLATNGWLLGWLQPPWFTPALCAGAAFHADPQSLFYSPVQLLAVFFDPFQASHLATLLFAAVAFWGCHALARRVFGWEPLAATLFGVLGMAHSMLPLRSALGHLGYQGYYLWPLLVLALCWPAADRRLRGHFWPIAGVCACLTAWLMFGFAGMMVPAFLSALALCLALVLQGRARLSDLILRGAAGGVLAIALNISKLHISASLMRNFPRDFYGMPGFASLGEAVGSVLFALLLPSEWAADFGHRHLQGVRFSALPHEWAMSFGWGAALAALAAGAVWLARRGATARASAPTVNGTQVLALLGLVLVLSIPLLLLWHQGALQALVKRIPILNSTTWPMRWIVIYVPLVQWLLCAPLAACLRKLPPRAALAAAAAAGAVIWAGPLTEPVDYYLTSELQNYDPKPVLRAYRASRENGPIPIHSIAMPTEGLGLNRNDTVLEGATQGFCYNPIYGYRLEAQPQRERLRAGPALAPDASGRQTVLLNPACLVYPEANQCRPGDGFRLDDPHQREQAARFLARQPIDWERPPVAQAFAWVSRIGLLLAAGALLVGAWMLLRRRRAPRA